MPKLRNHDGTGYVSIPKDDLDRDGRVNEDGSIDETTGVVVERLGEGVHLVRISDESNDLPEVSDCPAVKRLASEVAVDLIGSSSPTVTSD